MLSLFLMVLALPFLAMGVRSVRDLRRRLVAGGRGVEWPFMRALAVLPVGLVTLALAVSEAVTSLEVI